MLNWKNMMIVRTAKLFFQTIFQMFGIQDVQTHVAQEKKFIKNIYIIQSLGQRTKDIYLRYLQ